ncbi:unnamed protein product [Amoebophrya sp. A120]|nr:unnamed protein product [Amoebophrya sp. A120]|eukprot:GSA120T00006694001.1
MKKVDNCSKVSVVEAVQFIANEDGAALWFIRCNAMDVFMTTAYFASSLFSFHFMIPRVEERKEPAHSCQVFSLSA